MMSLDEILKKTASMGNLLSTFTDRNASSFVVDHHEDLLPHFSHMQKISKCQSDARMRKLDDITRRIKNLQEGVYQFDGLLDSSNNMAESLMYIVNSSRILVNLLNEATRNNAIPLPRQYQEHFLKIIKNCSFVVSCEGNWNPSSINWPKISSALKSTADIFEGIAEIMDSSIEEHCLLQHKTLEMLEQMTKLVFH